MSMASKLAGTLIAIAFAALLTGALLPPGDVSKQLMAVSFWFIAGFCVSRIWL